MAINKKSKFIQCLCIVPASLLLTLTVSSSLAEGEQILFDDFNYNSTSELTNNGWNVRGYAGGPGLSNGGWDASNVYFVDTGTNKSMRLRASTNINGNNITNGSANIGYASQAEVSRNELEYKNGTWAARMYFNDAPYNGTDGDSIVETFFGLTSYIEGREPYSEIDFEYLANGGWYTGSSTPSMWSGTYRIVDWSDENNHGVTRTQGSLQGWHDLVMQVQNGQINFYIDGQYQTGFSGDVAPDYPMYLMFQIWFSNDCFDAACTRKGYLNTSSDRAYYEDIDWVYFEKDTLLTIAEVKQNIQNLRSNNIYFLKGAKPGGGDSGGGTGGGTTGQQCDWWGTIYAICDHIDSGWGWQNNADCVGINTCAALPDPFGVISGDGGSGDDGNDEFSLLIQAESYSNMQGVQTENTTDTGLGINVGWIDAGDWMSYSNTNIPTAGSYLVEYRVASINGATLTLDLSSGNSLGSVDIPATGDWQAWTTVSHVVTIPAEGDYDLGIYAPTGGWNINWFKITKQ